MTSTAGERCEASQRNECARACLSITSTSVHLHAADSWSLFLRRADFCPYAQRAWIALLEKETDPKQPKNFNYTEVNCKHTRYSLESTAPHSTLRLTAHLISRRSSFLFDSLHRLQVSQTCNNCHRARKCIALTHCCSIVRSLSQS